MRESVVCSMVPYPTSNIQQRRTFVRYWLSNLKKRLSMLCASRRHLGAPTVPSSPMHRTRGGGTRPLMCQTLTLCHLHALLCTGEQTPTCCLNYEAETTPTLKVRRRTTPIRRLSPAQVSRVVVTVSIRAINSSSSAAH